MFYALYDNEDNPFGTFNREELKQLIKTSNKSFRCIISRLNKGIHKSLYISGKQYFVYIYYEEKINEKGIFI